MKKETMPERILRSAPVNKMTAIGMHPGEKFETIQKLNQPIWFGAPPKVRRWNSGRPGENLAGRKFGRLTAIGIIKNGKWLVRCTCGAYEYRLAKAIKNPENQNDRCARCRRVAYLQTRETQKTATKFPVKLTLRRP